MTWANATATNPFIGVRLITSHQYLATSDEIDRSKIRSLPRALRRQRKRPLPMRQVPTAYQVGDTLYVHPSIMRAMQDRMRIEEERAFLVLAATSIGGDDDAG